MHYIVTISFTVKVHVGAASEMRNDVPIVDSTSETKASRRLEPCEEVAAQRDAANHVNVVRPHLPQNKKKHMQHDTDRTSPIAHAERLGLAGFQSGSG